jgi:hypothetical protein
MIAMLNLHTSLAGMAGAQGLSRFGGHDVRDGVGGHHQRLSGMSFLVSSDLGTAMQIFTCFGGHPSRRFGADVHQGFKAVQVVDAGVPAGNSRVHDAGGVFQSTSQHRCSFGTWRSGLVQRGGRFGAQLHRRAGIGPAHVARAVKQHGDLAVGDSLIPAVDGVV